MNFVKLYIGDYMRDTGTLTVAEHGAYVLMLLHHYATERPLPTGRELHRLLRAESKAEREAIDSVAVRFWIAGEAGLTNKRAAEEMHKAEHQREVNRIVGKLGGRPKRTETESLTESQPKHNPNHSQTPDKDITPPQPAVVAPPKLRASRKCPADFVVTEAMLRWAASEAPGVPWQAEHAKFSDHTFRTAINDWPGAWRNWMRKAQEFALQRRPVIAVAGETAFQKSRRENVAAFTGGLAARRVPAEKPKPELIDEHRNNLPALG